MIVVDVCAFGGEALGRLERHYIREFAPVWNISGEHCSDGFQKVWMTVISEELVVSASRILRQANPRLTTEQWVHLVMALKDRGERELAGKIARLARQRNVNLKQLRSHPLVIFPCPAPKYVLNRLSRVINRVCGQMLPHYQQTPLQSLVKDAQAVWSRSAFVEQIIAPSIPPFRKIGSCQCDKRQSQRNYHGHTVWRRWQDFPECSHLAGMFGEDTLQQRTIPDVDDVWERVLPQVRKLLIAAGFANGGTGISVDAGIAMVSGLMESHLEKWRHEGPRHLIQRDVSIAARPVWKAGLVFVRLDRNPGRVVIMCVEAWRKLNALVFSHERYQLHPEQPSNDDAEWSSEIRRSRSTIGRPLAMPFKSIGAKDLGDLWGTGR
jgi:hypothetical protein